MRLSANALTQITTLVQNQPPTYPNYPAAYSVALQDLTASNPGAAGSDADVLSFLDDAEQINSGAATPVSVFVRADNAAASLLYTGTPINLFGSQEQASSNAVASSFFAATLAGYPPGSPPGTVPDFQHIETIDAQNGLSALGLGNYPQAWAGAMPDTAQTIFGFKTNKYYDNLTLSQQTQANEVHGIALAVAAVEFEGQGLGLSQAAIDSINLGTEKILETLFIDAIQSVAAAIAGGGAALTVFSQAVTALEESGTQRLNDLQKYLQQLFGPTPAINASSNIFDDGPGTNVDLSSPSAPKFDVYLPSSTAGYQLSLATQIPILVFSEGSVAGNGITVSTGSVISLSNGSPTNTAASITGSEWAINAAGPLAVTNFCSIAGGLDGIILNAGGSIINGSTTDTSSSITGDLSINIGSANASQVSNFGTIADGIGDSGSGLLTVTNGSASDTKARITAPAAGSDGVGAVRAVTLVNFGSIYGSNDGLGVGGGSSVTNGSATDTSASISGGYGMVFAGSGTSTVSNFGVISASYADAVRLSQGGSVINGSASDKTASITGAKSGWGVDSSGGSVTNFGSISGGVGCIYLGSGTLINAGAITSATGSGTAVEFGSGVSRLVEDAGSALTGVVYGAGASTTLELAAGKSGSIASGLANVGTVAVDAGASWTATGTYSVPSVINDGTVAIASGGSLDVSSAVDPSSTGIFQLMTKGSLEIGAILGSALKIQFLGSAPTNKLVVDKAASFGTHVGTTSYAGPLLESFTAGDVIDLKGIGSTGLTLNYSAVSADLQITGTGGTALATLAFQNSTLGAGAFHAASDGAGGALITHS